MHHFAAKFLSTIPVHGPYHSLSSAVNGPYSHSNGVCCSHGNAINSYWCTCATFCWIFAGSSSKIQLTPNFVEANLLRIWPGTTWRAIISVTDTFSSFPIGRFEIVLLSSFIFLIKGTLDAPLWNAVEFLGKTKTVWSDNISTFRMWPCNTRWPLETQRAKQNRVYCCRFCK